MPNISGTARLEKRHEIRPGGPAIIMKWEQVEFSERPRSFNAHAGCI